MGGERRERAAVCGLTVSLCGSRLPVLRLLHLRSAPERAAKEHGGSCSSDRQSPQTGHPGHGDGRHWYSVLWRQRHLLVFRCHDVVIQASAMIRFTDLASAEKKRLEEKQRAARKNRTKPADEWKTR